jgi:hypothetical protein
MSGSACAPHPIGVCPTGNLYCEGAPPCIRRTSLGPHLSRLPDALLCRLLAHCSADALLALALTSRAAYAYARDEDLWRALTLRTFRERFRFAGSWRATYATASVTRGGVSGVPAAKRPRVVRATGVYSDVLFHKWRCATAVMQGAWLERDNAVRVDGTRVSVDEFRERYERPGVPVVVTGLVPGWRASDTWSEDHFRDEYGDVSFVAGGYDFPMRHYLEYADSVQGRCDQPLYLFDSDFARKAPALAEDYEVPAYFSEDLFQHLGNDVRPHYRWLIVGPKHSGSSFHKDPNATSAWNACVRGSKKWILFPPHTPPPGVHPTADESDVTAPLSVLEWYINFYDAAREAGARVGSVECIVRSGELLFVPSGWWHCAVNLEWSAAVTQNYVSAVNFANVARWLDARPEQVSGCRDAAHAGQVASSFVESVLRERPELRAALQGSSDGGGVASKRARCGVTGGERRGGADAAPFKKKKEAPGLWDRLRVASESDAGAQGRQFSFGLG